MSRYEQRRNWPIHFLALNEIDCISCSKADGNLHGSAGLEKHFDSLLKDEIRAGLPFEVSIDLALQFAVEEVLERVVRQKIAAGAASVLMKPASARTLSALP